MTMTLPAIVAMNVVFSFDSILSAMALSEVFWVMATGAAIGMGSTQSVSRAFMAQLSPPEREAEFFGFYVLSGKLASTVGPLLFGVISAASGSQRLAVLSLTPLFLIGLGLLATVQPPDRRPLS